MKKYKMIIVTARSLEELNYSKEKLSLIGLDKTPFIRELGGYVFQSGSRNKDVPGTFDVVNVLGTHDAGKMAFEIYASEIDSFTSYLTSVLNYIK